mmetsp:Transcript_37853/g.84722  ORF Transcript_37853/g.84722 Transcript_37853/m.84722 type:complete len:227 (+) Transcript_37853:732-1412(+)
MSVPLTRSSSSKYDTVISAPASSAIRDRSTKVSSGPYCQQHVALHEWAIMEMRLYMTSPSVSEPWANALYRQETSIFWYKSGSISSKPLTLCSEKYDSTFKESWQGTFSSSGAHLSRAILVLFSSNSSIETAAAKCHPDPRSKGWTLCTSLTAAQTFGCLDGRAAQMGPSTKMMSPGLLGSLVNRHLPLLSILRTSTAASIFEVVQGVASPWYSSNGITLSAVTSL